MGAIKEEGDRVYSDFTMAGVEASGKKEPPKADIRAWISIVDRDVYAAQAGIAQVADTAARDAFFADAANQGKLVYVNNNNDADDDPANGVYEYVDGAPRIATGFYQGISVGVQSLVDEAETYATNASDSADAAEAQADSIKSLMTKEDGIAWEIAFTNEARTRVAGGFEKLPDGATRFRAFDMLLPDGVVTEESLAPDLQDSLSAARYVAELDGGALWSNDLRTGQRVQLAAAGASDPVVMGDAMLYTVGGERVWRPCDGSKPVAPAFSRLTSIVTIGDSLTADNRGIGSIGDLFGVPTRNRGHAGNSVNDIATRVGALSPLLTLDGDELPAAGVVAATAIEPATGWSQYVDVTFTGTILGEPVTIQWDHVAETRTVTRINPGAAIPVPPGTPFVSTEHPVTDREYVCFIWIGRNAVGTPTFEADTLNAHELIRATLTPFGVRCIGVSVTNSQTEGIGTTNYDKIVSCNAKIAALYGDDYYDLRRDFIDNGLAMAGITPEPGDEAAIADDRPPPSLMFDNVHPDGDGYPVQKQMGGNVLISKGWFA